MYFLDTNTCVYFLNGKYEYIRNKVVSIPPNEIAIPSLVKAELLFGAYKSQRRMENLEKIERFLEPFQIIPFADETTYVYSEIRNETEKAGKIVGPNDLIIAAIVMQNKGILVTNNQDEFSRINGLNIENWAK